MAHADAMIYITERKLEQLVGQDTRRVRKPKQRMIRKRRPEAHGARMQDSLITKTAQASMPVHNLNLLTDANIAKYGKERKDGRKGGLAVDDEKGDVVDLEAVGEVAHALPAVVVGVCDDDDLVPAVDQLAGDLVDVRLNTAGLREEEVADHGDVVCLARHGCDWGEAGGAEIMVCCVLASLYMTDATFKVSGTEDE